MVSNRDFICVEHNGVTEDHAFTMSFCSIQEDTSSFPGPKRGTVRGEIRMAGWHIRDLHPVGSGCEVTWMTVCDPRASLPSMLQAASATSGASVLNKIKALVESDTTKGRGRDRRRSVV